MNGPIRSTKQRETTLTNVPLLRVNPCDLVDRLFSLICRSVPRSLRGEVPYSFIRPKDAPNFFHVTLIMLLAFVYMPPGATEVHVAATQTIAQPEKPLAAETFNLTEAMEVGLEIQARSPGASWARKGAEAAALSISVDGVYNQDLLLWAGDELFPYRVMLGRFSKGRHTVSMAINLPRCAA